ncbi:hypothetical protein B9Z19DRAFT_844700 [Tuber borchii]|uniref:Uncharacterized protein n=1 Tax=Tuber borchii TaxID=42251 RepID=A0A2T6ZUT0_TUBBO|nr:hypothetical protein B9Z19DRAFT_844700 [Tuber borchii]
MQCCTSTFSIDGFFSCTTGSAIASPGSLGALVFGPGKRIPMIIAKFPDSLRSPLCTSTIPPSPSNSYNISFNQSGRFSVMNTNYNTSCGKSKLVILCVPEPLAGERRCKWNVESSAHKRFYRKNSRFHTKILHWRKFAKIQTIYDILPLKTVRTSFSIYKCLLNF